jgi:hypothetical protein
MRTWTTLVLASLLLAPVMGRCADGPDGSSWQNQAKKAGLGAADIERLGKQKLLIGPHSYKQAFTPYLGKDLPLFVTADSLLNGYHVLYEESVLRLETAQAQRLPERARALWEALRKDGLQLDGKPDLAAAARQRARLVIGVALELLGDKAAHSDATLTPLIEEEARHVLAAAGSGKPKWLGPPDEGFVALDYTRYQPRGFYTRNEQLKRYFRAVAWLQSIPFRADKDEELLAALVLGTSVRSTEGLHQKWLPACHRYQEFAGVEDDWDLLMMESVAEGVGQEGWVNGWPARTARRDEPRLDLGGKDLDKIRAALVKHAAEQKNGPALNDQLAFPPHDSGQAAPVEFRVLSASRLPDAVLFQHTTDPRSFKRALPEGLEVCALLGSSFARERLGGKNAGELLKVIDGSQRLLAGTSLYCDYLKCLEALLAPPEPDAPALFASEAWRAKGCQTALAGWAQLRHTWVLQGKQNVHYLSAVSPPAGFVEPNPEFYARLGELARRTSQLLEDYQALGPPLTDLADKLRLAAKINESDKPLQDWSPREVSAVETVMFLPVGRGDLTTLASQLERGELPADPDLRKALVRAGLDIAEHWERLARLCDRLEMLAHKQLRGAAFNARDEAFLRHYGIELARIMLYEGNSYLTPEDDAPRIVDVFTDAKAGRVLEVGIGRPRALFLLYPVEGEEVLCRGAVLPYHEFAHPARLDDASWKGLLDSGEPPNPPSWLQPILSAAPVAKDK